jgi:basic membrane lipoprotein Med (substrate-binding protein (PBP1-ABC) superfamily)
MKKLLFVLVLIFALVLTACGGAPVEEMPAEEAPAEEAVAEESPAEEAPATEEPVEEMAEPFKVAVIMPSSITDLAFSQSIFDALLSIQEEMGGEEAMEIAYSEGMFKVDDAAAAIRDYAAEGYDLVVAHGSQYGSSLQEIAPDFPETAFAWGTTLETYGEPNISAYDANSHEGGYVNGVLAATVSESGVIGVVGPIEVGDAALYVKGFIAGAESVNPDVDVKVIWTGSFGDTGLGTEAGNTHIAAGADVLTGTAQMVTGAIGLTQEQGLAWFGTQSAQTSVGPDSVVASQVYNWTGPLKEIIAGTQEGDFGGEAYTITLENGGLVMDYNSNYALSDEAKAAADAAVAGIIDGSLVIPVE